MTGKTLALAALLVTGALLLSSCKGRDVQERLERTIANHEKHWPEDRQVIAELKRATPESLKTPKLVSADLFPNGRLVVFWIEDHPTPTGIRIRDRSGKSQRHIDIDELYYNENQLTAAVSVLFRYVHVLATNDDDWSDLNKLVSSGNADIALVIGGSVISKAIPLVAYRPEGE